MGLPANYKIVNEQDNGILIEDLGPWDKHLTITNDVERVVKSIAHKIKGKRLFYIDSTQQIDEILHLDGEFVGFAISEVEFEHYDNSQR